MKIAPLTPVFAARIEDVDLTRPLDDAVFGEIRAAFEEHSVPVQRTTVSGDPREPPVR